MLTAKLEFLKNYVFEVANILFTIVGSRYNLLGYIFFQMAFHRIPHDRLLIKPCTI